MSRSCTSLGGSEPEETQDGVRAAGRAGGAGQRGSPTSVLAAVNGSPATITIETCEDPSDWTTAIGGAASLLWCGLLRGGGLGVLVEEGAMLGGRILLWVKPVVGSRGASAR